MLATDYKGTTLLYLLSKCEYFPLILSSKLSINFEVLFIQSLEKEEENIVAP